MSKINKTGRFRHWSLVLYCSSIELDKILIIYAERINKSVHIVHDKCLYQEDLKDDLGNYVHRAGDLEKKHIHLLVSFHYAHTFSAVKRLFTTKEDNPRCEPINDMVRMYRYLLHLDNPEKYQYSKNELISADLKYYDDIEKKGQRDDKDNIAFEIIRDLMAHTPPLVMLQRYGRDYVIHKKAYQEMYEDIRDYDIANYENHKDNDNWIEQVGL